MTRNHATNGLFELLRQARLDRGLSQAQLAARIGFGQRQISDLERAAIDPRLSTLQNVARALDLELMLVPRDRIMTVHSLLHEMGDTAARPMYVLDEEDTDGEPEKQSS